MDLQYFRKSDNYLEELGKVIDDLLCCLKYHIAKSKKVQKKIIVLFYVNH